MEQVPGLLSSNGGRDFAEVLRTLDELGFGLAWRTLDSRYLGVPQRRRRIYLVGRAGEPCPAEVLFEPEGGAGDIAAGGEEGQGAAGEVGVGVARSLRARPNKSNREDSDTYIPGATVMRMREGKDGGGKGPLIREGESLTLATANDQTLFRAASVRRLTPTECEKLQGFPDGWTCLCGVEPYDTNTCTCADGPRYAALGNAVTVNASTWVLKRLAAVAGTPVLPFPR